MTTAMENKRLEEVLKLLAPLESATRDISGEHYLTVSMAIPVVKNLKSQINAISPTSTIATNLKKHISSEIKKRLDTTESISVLGIGTLLDPRFKTLYFQNPESFSKSINEVKYLMRNLKHDSPTHTHGSSDSDSGGSTKGLI